MAANQTTNSLLKLNQFAKDIGMKAKDVVGVLEAKGVAVKSQKTLEPHEFELMFEALTKENQITNIEDYLDGITYIPSKKAAKPEKVEEKAAEPVAEASKEDKAVPAKAEKTEKAEPVEKPKRCCRTTGV